MPPTFTPPPPPLLHRCCALLCLCTGTIYVVLVMLHIPADPPLFVIQYRLASSLLYIVYQHQELNQRFVFDSVKSLSLVLHLTLFISTQNITSITLVHQTYHPMLLTFDVQLTFGIDENGFLLLVNSLCCTSCSLSCVWRSVHILCTCDGW